MNVHVALLHYPVYNRQRQVIVSAVTNLDIHDIARISLTFGVKSYSVVTPLADQRELVERLLSHWREGYGSQSHPERKMALELVTMAASLADVVARITRQSGQKPELLATGAAHAGVNLNYSEAKQRIRTKRPMLIIFGTGWGLSKEVLDMADYRLAPIRGASNYNHLSVRSAAAIILDRLLGTNDEE